MGELTTPEAIASLRRRHSALKGWATVVEFMFIDLIAVGFQAGHKFAVHGYEVKVSRSDWLKELKDLSKAEKGQVYCDYWYLAAPPGVMRDGELPDGWGYVEVHKNRTVLKCKPKRLRPAPERNVYRGEHGGMLNSPEWRERQVFAELARRLAYEQADREELEGLLEDIFEADTTKAKDRAAKATNRLTSSQKEANKRFQQDLRQRKSDEKVHLAHQAQGVDYSSECPYGWCAQFASMDTDLSV